MVVWYLLCNFSIPFLTYNSILWPYLEELSGYENKLCLNMSKYHCGSHFSKYCMQNLITSHSCFYERMANKFAEILSFVNEKRPSDNRLHLIHQDTFNSYLHCTSIVAVSDAFPHSLLASHLYSPASFLLMFVNTRSLTLKRSPPSATLIQDTIGWGVPDALHDRVTLPPSVMFSLCIGSTTDGTVHINK